jgi:histidyl-tRNA synthetase
VRLEINSASGSPRTTRRAHREALVAYFEQHAACCSTPIRERRLQSNPLRILDSKNPAMQPLIEAAPKLIDFLGPESPRWRTSHAVRDDAGCGLGLAYRVNPRLVRGMDYYNLTVFEWVTDQLGSQGTVCGGGRYDGLIEQLGRQAGASRGFRGWASNGCCCCCRSWAFPRSARNPMPTRWCPPGCRCPK